MLQDEIIVLLGMREMGYPNPERAMMQAKTVKDELDMAVFDAVRVARKKGHTWDEIAQALGVSRQTTWEKYHKRLGID